ncbi:hypothetical protein KP509_23G078600 [Ceratopteris richardii]|uniref:Association with the SNF1 complex (ASC) domain-containing protein n=1 Tax=Ceratopteris richardii TaxID=49495 RepID=A0A8T2S3I1_CERRI|nr:hypothetical protein KP509_23G078600 [Ceratopteris richardii]KAH7302588.1 hypothetical protein KP509_23G078600 [Ceratopteris richardii]KAH7302589.1 hypothetical protein KP509_23G078600 [Ceratopteris richardii]
MENAENGGSREPPRSPGESYDNPFNAFDDESKDPPTVPPQLLQRTLLNIHQSDYGSCSSNPPHVLLNHLYIENGEIAKSVLALGFTHRYRSKYVTVVLYKPISK